MAMETEEQFKARLVRKASKYLLPEALQAYAKSLEGATWNQLHYGASCNFSFLGATPLVQLDYANILLSQKEIDIYQAEDKRESSHEHAKHGKIGAIKEVVDRLFVKPHEAKNIVETFVQKYNLLTFEEKEVMATKEEVKGQLDYYTKQVTFAELKPGMVLRSIQADGSTAPFMDAVVTDIDDQRKVFAFDRAHPMGRERLLHCTESMLQYWHAVCYKGKPCIQSY